VNERRILKVWHAKSKGLAQSLSLMDRNLATLSAATPGEQAVAASLAWHLSSSACKPPLTGLVRELVAAVEQHVASAGWTGTVALCCGGDHFLVGTTDEGLTWNPPGCFESAHAYEIADLSQMMTALQRG
jgi:hypothetical protein